MRWLQSWVGRGVAGCRFVRAGKCRGSADVSDQNALTSLRGEVVKSDEARGKWCSSGAPM
jgi:hypothetical protein